MAKARLPAAKAAVSGSAIHDPQRFRGRGAPKHQRPLGEPYANMTASEKKVWLEMAGDMPWLNSGHRLLVRLACHHAARLCGGKDFGVSATQALSSILSKLGATPVDETKVNHGEDGDEDASDRFFRPTH